MLTRLERGWGALCGGWRARSKAGGEEGFLSCSRCSFPRDSPFSPSFLKWEAEHDHVCQFVCVHPCLTLSSSPRPVLLDGSDIPKLCIYLTRCPLGTATGGPTDISNFTSLNLRCLLDSCLSFCFWFFFFNEGKWEFIKGWIVYSWGESEQAQVSSCLFLYSNPKSWAAKSQTWTETPQERGSQPFSRNGNTLTTRKREVPKSRRLNPVAAGGHSRLSARRARESGLCSSSGSSHPHRNTLCKKARGGVGLWHGRRHSPCSEPWGHCIFLAGCTSSGKICVSPSWSLSLYNFSLVDLLFFPL